MADKTILFRVLAISWLAGTLLLLFMPGDSLPSEAWIPYQDKVAHFVLFSGYSFFWILGFGSNNTASSKTTVIRILIVGIVIGIISELIQEKIPGRGKDPVDLLMDLFGLLAGYIFSQIAQKRNLFGSN